MSGVMLEEEADYGRLPFDIFVLVSFSNLLFGLVLTWQAGPVGSQSQCYQRWSGTVGAARLGMGEPDANRALCMFLFSLPLLATDPLV
jgi:hypothetical protein